MGANYSDSTLAPALTLNPALAGVVAALWLLCCSSVAALLLLYGSSVAALWPYRELDWSMENASPISHETYRMDPR